MANLGLVCVLRRVVLVCVSYSRMIYFFYFFQVSQSEGIRAPRHGKTPPFQFLNFDTCTRECLMSLSAPRISRICVACVVRYIDIFANCNWVNTRWQCYSTHNQYIEEHNNNRTTQITAQHNNNRKTIAQLNDNYF